MKGHRRFYPHLLIALLFAIYCIREMLLLLLLGVIVIIKLLDMTRAPAARGAASLLVSMNIIIICIGNKWRVLLPIFVTNVQGNHMAMKSV